MLSLCLSPGLCSLPRIARGLRGAAFPRSPALGPVSVRSRRLPLGRQAGLGVQRAGRPQHLDRRASGAPGPPDHGVHRGRRPGDLRSRFHARRLDDRLRAGRRRQSQGRDPKPPELRRRRRASGLCDRDGRRRAAEARRGHGAGRVALGRPCRVSRQGPGLVGARLRSGEARAGVQVAGRGRTARLVAGRKAPRVRLPPRRPRLRRRLRHGLALRSGIWIPRPTATPRPSGLETESAWLTFASRPPASCRPSGRTARASPGRSAWPTSRPAQRREVWRAERGRGSVFRDVVGGAAALLERRRPDRLPLGEGRLDAPLRELRPPGARRRC